MPSSLTAPNSTNVLQKRSLEARKQGDRYELLQTSLRTDKPGLMPVNDGYRDTPQQTTPWHRERAEQAKMEQAWRNEQLAWEKRVRTEHQSRLLEQQRMEEQVVERYLRKAREQRMKEFDAAMVLSLMSSSGGDESRRQ